MKKQMDVLRASASMPLVSQIVEFDGKKYLDGGIADSIPLHAFQQMGYERCVVVQTRAAGYRKKKNKLAWLARLLYRKYPNFVKAIENRHLMYNQELEEIEKLQQKGEVLVIRPSKEIKISHTEQNTKVLKAVYDLGREDATNILPRLKEFIAKS